MNIGSSKIKHETRQQTLNVIKKERQRVLNWKGNNICTSYLTELLANNTALLFFELMFPKEYEEILNRSNNIQRFCTNEVYIKNIVLTMLLPEKTIDQINKILTR